MLNGNLLISGEATMTIVIVCVTVFAVASILYGLFRKFSQMGWLPWQLPIIFALSFLTELVPAMENGYLRYAICVGIFLAGTALVFGTGAVIRYFMHAKMRPALLIWRFFDRLLGVVTALLGYAVILLSVGGLALSFLSNVLPDLLGSLPLPDLPIVDWVLAHALDFFVVTIFACSIQAGYRIGMGRAILYGIMFVLTAGSFFAAAYLTGFVSPFRKAAGVIARGFSNLTPSVASLIGFSITTLILFIIFFAVSCLIGFLLNKLLRRIRYVRLLGIVDGILFSLVFFALMCALAAGVQYLAYYIAHCDLSALGELGNALPLDTVREWALRVEAFMAGAPFARLLYETNPLILLLPV